VAVVRSAALALPFVVTVPLSCATTNKPQLVRVDDHHCHLYVGYKCPWGATCNPPPPRLVVCPSDLKEFDPGALQAVDAGLQNVAATASAAPTSTATTSPTATPTAASGAPRSTVIPSASAAPERLSWSDTESYRAKLNPTDAQGRTISVRWSDTAKCYVSVPLPPEQRTKLAYARAVEVPCPPIMSQPAFKQCSGTVKTDGQSCACFRGGNPPPPPVRVPCPQ